MIENIKSEIEKLKEKSAEYLKYIDISSIEDEISKLEEKTGKASFWEDNKEANKVVKRISLLKRRIEPWKDFIKNFDDLLVLQELSEEENTNELNKEIEELFIKLSKKFADLELLELLSDENDKCNAIVNIHPGAGGTEACDWAAMLFRMYSRWAESKDFKVDILDWLDGDGAGIKNVTFLIEGDNSYGLLKYESGIHRLVRISPFDSNARRHTSFASVYVTPDIEDNIEFEIKQEELKIDTYRASGAGGQHVNKTDSAVRITHLPTGIVVQCQNERSQYKNKAFAMKVLKAKLYDYYKKEQEKEKEKENPEKKDIAWGSQIRSYIFQPYTMVKDHRTKTEIGNIQGVMDGNIDIFIDSELKMFGINTKK